VRSEDVEALYGRHARDLFAFLAFRAGDRALAEDLLADTFERVIRTRSRRRRGSTADRAWLYKIALNVFRDHLRRERAAERSLGAIAGEPPADPGELDAAANRDAVMRALAILSAEEREAVALRFGAGLTVPEIAAATGQPLARAEGRLYRGLRKLRGPLEGVEVP
jgi:RNA polymerase sigma-70 factor (ECF subfamily)